MSYNLQNIQLQLLRFCSVGWTNERHMKYEQYSTSPFTLHHLLFLWSTDLPFLSVHMSFVACLFMCLAHLQFCRFGYVLPILYLILVYGFTCLHKATWETVYEGLNGYGYWVNFFIKKSFQNVVCNVSKLNINIARLWLRLAQLF